MSAGIRPTTQNRTKLIMHRALTLLCLVSGLVSLTGAAHATLSTLRSEIAINTHTTSDQDFAVVAADPQGGFVVVWETSGLDGSGDAVAMRRFDALGAPLGDEVMVNTTTEGNQHDPHVAVAADGSIVVVWDSGADQDGDQRGIYGQRFDALGMAVGGEFLVNQITAGDQNDAVVAMVADQGFVVLWEIDAAGPSGEDVRGRRFSVDAVALGDEFAVNQITGFDQEDVAVDADAAGNFVVVWESGDDTDDIIAGRRYDVDGLSLGPEFTIDAAATSGGRFDPDVAVAPDGSFVVVWEDDAEEPGDLALFARFYDSAGVALGDRFQIDSFAGGMQERPRVDLDAAGQALIVWESVAQDGSGPGIIISRFDSAGNQTCPELVVNTTSAGTQIRPFVAVGATGRTMVVWDSTGQDGSGTGIVGRTVATAFFADGFESGDTSAWSDVTP